MLIQEQSLLFTAQGSSKRIAKNNACILAVMEIRLSIVLSGLCNDMAILSSYEIHANRRIVGLLFF